MKTVPVDDFDVSVTSAWPSLSIITLSTFLALCILWWQHPSYGRNIGPIVFPFVGCLPQMLMNANKIYDWVAEEVSKTPTRTMRAPVPGWNIIRTANPANVEHILKTKFENYPKGELYRTLFSEFAGVGMFTEDGSVWKMQRKFASPYFSTHRLRGVTLQLAQKGLVDRFIPVLDSFCDKKTVVDLQDLLFRSTFDAFCQLAFGYDPGCLNLSLSSVPFVTAYDEAFSISFRRIVGALPPWRIKRLLNIGSERKLLESLLTVDAFAFDMIRARRQELLAAYAGGQCKQECVDYLSSCIQLADEFVESPEIKQRLEEDPRSKSASVQASDLFIRDLMINSILAGRDTSASGLSWFFWLLSRNRKVEAKIWHENQATLASRSDELSEDSEPGESTTRMRELDSKTFSFEELKGMHYLHAALTESMRLYPPAPQTSKVAAANDVLPDGTAISEGTVVVIQHYAMGRNASIWGSDCLAFLPERFLRAGSFVAPSPFAYAVFVAGPRMCLGMDMDMMQMKLVVATLLHRYVFVVREGHCAKGVWSTSMRIEEGLPVYVRRREG